MFLNSGELSLRVERGCCAGAMWYPTDAKGGEVGHTLLSGQNSSVPHTEVQCVRPRDLDSAQALATARLLGGHCRSCLWPLHSRLSAGFRPIGPDGQPPPLFPRSCGNYKDAIVSFPSETAVKFVPLPWEQVWLAKCCDTLPSHAWEPAMTFPLLCGSDPGLRLS